METIFTNTKKAKRMNHINLFLICCIRIDLKGSNKDIALQTFVYFYT